MKVKRYWKKIAVLVMTTAFLLQGQAVLAAETETVVTETAETKEVKAAPQTEAPAPQTEAPQTEAPAPQTEAPAPQTEAPQTEAPAPQTEAPQTEAPQTEAPQTEAPQTEAPQTEAPQTEAPQTEAPQTEAPQTEAPQTEAPQTEAPQTETSQTEVPETEAAQTEEVQTESESETETEKDEETVYKTDFRFENGEVIIIAKASTDAKLPENTEMKVKKLEVGSAEYEEAKKASEAKLGVSEDAEYLFYDVTFVSDGKELDPAEGTVVVQVEFKTIQVDGSAQQQSVLQIDDTASGKVAKDVTAAAPEGSNMSSVKFAF